MFIQIITVPGNHDCDFEKATNVIRNSLLKDKNLDLCDFNIIKTCTDIQNNYFVFVDEWDGKLAELVGVREDSIFTEHILNYEGITLKFHCFNTAWCSTIDERPKELRISIPQQLGDKTDDDIVIVLLHHDEAWLDGNSAEIWKKYYKNYADVVFVGHDHTSEIVLKDNYGAATNYFVKGNQLYSSYHPEQSGFNILKINLETNIERFFSYKFDGTIYKNMLDTKSNIFRRNRFIQTGVELKAEFLDYLEEMDIDLTNKVKGTLKLSDIYVYPVLKGGKIDSKKEKKYYREKEDILAVIKEEKYILFYGEKEYGKTALVKKLYKDFFDIKFYPVIVDATKLKTDDGDDLNKIIADFYCSQYNNLEEEIILQMDSEKKVCIIDNLEDALVSDKVLKKILHYLTCKFGIVLITSNLQNDMLNFVKNVEVKEYLENKFTKLYIQEIKRYMRNKLVNKWLLLEDNERDVNSQEFDVLRRNKLSRIQNVMKTGFFNKTPIEFLLVLSYLDNYEKMNTNYSRYSYIYECLILDKINEIADGDTNEATMYRTILEQLAYRIYNDNDGEDVDESLLLKVISDYKEDYRGSKDGYIDIVNNISKYKILEMKNSKYRFKHSYMYYYFTGSYIQNQLPPLEKSKKINQIFSDLSEEINFNIALFLAYDMNVQYEILPQVQEICNGLLSQYKDFKYTKQKELLEKLECNIDDEVDKIFDIPQNANIPIIQEKKALAKDEIEEALESSENSNEIVNGEEENEEEMDEMMKDFTKSVRMIEFLGDILKNYSSAIKSKPRIEIINLMYDTSIKLMGVLYDSLNDMIDTIIGIVDERSKEDKDEIVARSQFKQKTNEFLRQFWAAFVSLNVSNLSFSLQSDRIADEILDFRDEKKCTFFDLTSIDYFIRTQNGHLPVKDIEKCVKGKNKLDGFSLKVLSQNVSFFLKNYQYDEKDKKAVCSLLNFNIKDVFIEEQKIKAIKNI